MRDRSGVDMGKTERVSEEERKGTVETEAQTRKRAEAADETKGDKSDLNEEKKELKAEEGPVGEGKYDAGKRGKEEGGEGPK